MRMLGGAKNESQIRLADQGLPDLRTPLYVAAEMGGLLGGRGALFAALSASTSERIRGRQAVSHRFQREVRIARPAAEVFAWHERPGALERLTPPWQQVKLVKASDGVTDGQRVVLKSKMGPAWITWEVEHFDYVAGQQFCDRQIAGPFASWEHVHRFSDDGNGGCILSDEIEYTLPGGAVGAMAAGQVEARLDQMFAYRHAVTKADLEMIAPPPGHVLISGASGMIGSTLVPFLKTQGWKVDRLVRRASNSSGEISWNPRAGTIDWPEDYRCDAVIHLAGANIAEGRWTAERRDILQRSRIESTRALIHGLKQLPELPGAFLSGSAIGIYGSRGDDEVAETSDRGEGFLAGLCQDWEAEADSAEALGMRTVKLRTGIVMTPAGGALAKLLPIFKSAMGGPLGDGRFWQSWISIDDWLRATLQILGDDAISGPVNLVAPEPVRQRDFATILGRVLNRPAVIPTPAFAVKLAFGQMADEALLASTRVQPAVLQAQSFEFLHPSLENALRHVLGRPK